MNKEKTMTVEHAVSHLAALYKGKDWFFEAGVEQYGRPVVYVHYSNYATLHDIPDYVGGHQVLVHFAVSKVARKDDFVDHGTPRREENLTFPLTRKIVDLSSEAELVEEEDKSIRRLTDELDKLERQCGTNILQDIFYEIHDGSNAVTNLSAKFPEVRTGLERLYKVYGFDIIYDEMDG